MPRIRSITLSTTPPPWLVASSAASASAPPHARVGVLPDGRRQFLHARGRFLERRSLRAGARRQVGVAARDLARAEMDRVGRLAHRAHGARDARLHRGEAAQHPVDLEHAACPHDLIEPALRDPLEMAAGFSSGATTARRAAA